MKQLKCEMCGSTDLLKQEGVFLCQNCGTKYSIEEAKKMMVEGVVEVNGTVKIDKTSEIVNLYNLAEKVLNTNDINKANEYANKILEIDSNNYLGWKLKTRIEFYIASLEGTGISKAINCAQMAYSCASEEEKEELKKFVITMTTAVANGYISRSLDAEDNLEFLDISLHLDVDKYFDSFKDEAISFFRNFYDEIATQQFIEFYADLITGLTNDIFQKQKSVRGWDFNIKILQYLLSIVKNKDNLYNCICYNLIAIIDERYKSNYTNDLNEYISKLFICIEEAKNNNPNFVLDKVTTGYIEEKNLNTQLLKTEKNATSSKNGCYVATCVYGSYDCPEVWTLRRFRDYTLNENWYGRLFIKTYYAISPKLVKVFGDAKWFKKFWKGKLDKMVDKLQERGYESTKYNDKF